MVHLSRHYPLARRYTARGLCAGDPSHCECSAVCKGGVRHGQPLARVSAAKAVEALPVLELSPNSGGEFNWCVSTGAKLFPTGLRKHGEKGVVRVWVCAPPTGGLAGEDFALVKPVEGLMLPSKE